MEEEVVGEEAGWRRSVRACVAARERRRDGGARTKSRTSVGSIALPIAPDDLLCYVAGTTRMRWRTYVWIILLCKPWALIAYGLGVSAVLLKFLPW